MNSFMYGGERISVLDMNAERGGKSSSEHCLSFAERAKEEIKGCSFFQKEHKFLTIYSEHCETRNTTDSEKGLRLCLVNPSYIYHPSRRKMSSVNALSVFVNKNGKFRPLWELHRFENTSYTFLSKPAIKDALKNIFQKVEIKLGALTYKDLPCIAWQLQTEEGVFYIPWHNGSIIEECENFTFEEKPFKELKKVYELLRFRSTGQIEDAYQILCC